MIIAMGFLIVLLIIFIIWRERYYTHKLWYHETLVNEIPFDSIMMDEQWRFRIISGSAVKDPVKRKWMIGKTEMDYWIHQRKDPKPGEKRLELFYKALEKRSFESLEETMVDRNGQERVYLRKVKPIFDDKGKHKASVGFTYELTAIKQKENELAILNNELKRSNEDLDNFAHVASHDLKTPLRSIASFIQLYERKNQARFDDTDKEYIRFISNSAKQMDSLINSLLSYSSIDRKKDEPLSINLNKTLNSVRLNLSSLVRERQGDIEYTTLPTIVAHDFLLIQLFQNLIGNGLKYNKNEKPTVEVYYVEKNNDLVYAIRDNGIGISSQYKETVFKIFHRLHGIGEYEGSGIGLAACKRIVEYYGGNIWFEPEEEGTTFYFTLPKCAVVEKPKPSDKDKIKESTEGALFV
jgi:signal transduction histidine kinase